MPSDEEFVHYWWLCPKLQPQCKQLWSIPGTYSASWFQLQRFYFLLHLQSPWFPSNTWHSYISWLFWRSGQVFCAEDLLLNLWGPLPKTMATSSIKFARVGLRSIRKIGWLCLWFTMRRVGRMPCPFSRVCLWGWRCRGSFLWDWSDHQSYISAR